MSFITEPINEYIIFEGVKFPVFASFDVVLDIQHLYKEKDLSEYDKLHTALSMFSGNSRKFEQLSFEQQSKLMDQIYEEQVTTKPRPRVGKQIRVVDFDQDSEYIYASFLQDYGIDLIESQGKLHWKKFIALFQGLSEKTKIKQIMQIRSRDIPAPTKYNQEEIKNLTELKAYYALDYKECNAKDGFSLLFDTLERMVIQ